MYMPERAYARRRKYRWIKIFNVMVAPFLKHAAPLVKLPNKFLDPASNLKVPITRTMSTKRWNTTGQERSGVDPFVVMFLVF